MKKKVAVVSVADAEEAARLADLPLEATVALADVAGAIKDGLLAFASATGLVVMHQMMHGRVDRGDRRRSTPRSEPTSVSETGTGTPRARSCSAGARSRPSARGAVAAPGEIGLDTWKAFSSADLLNSLVVERMLAGVATRRHVDVAEPVGEELEARSKSMSKSAISRRFVAATDQGAWAS